MPHGSAFLVAVHDTLGLPVLSMSGPTMTRDNVVPRMILRNKVIYTWSSTSRGCAILAVGRVNRHTFLYELEVAQTVPQHLVVLLDREAAAEGGTAGELRAWRSSKFFATPFMMPRKQVPYFWIHYPQNTRYNFS